MKLHDKEEDIIRKLADILNDTGLSEIELESKGQRFRVAKNLSIASSAMQSVPVVAPPANPAAAPAAIDETNAAQNNKSDSDMSNAVTSPMVGTIYLAPKPGAPSYVNIGDTVNEGDTLLIIEAMKVMNPIPAPKSGKVTKIFVDDGNPIEFGQPLMVIE